MNIRITATVIITILVVTGCDISALLGLNKEEDKEQQVAKADTVQDTNIYIQNFSFETKHNNQIPHDYDATIVADTITIKLPTFYLTEYGDALIPTISGRYSNIYPESGVARRFNSERTTMTYSISNAAGFIKTYRVQVEPILNSDAAMLQFTLEARKNAQLSEDYKGIIDHAQRTVVVLMHNEILQENNIFIPTIEISPGATITPEITTGKNFTTSVPYIIVSEDGSTSNTYNVIVTPYIDSIIDINDITLALYKRTEYDTQAVNVKQLNYHAEYADSNTYTLYTSPAEYLFFKDKYIGLEFDFKYPTNFKYEHEYYMLPHTYEILAADNITKKNITIDITPLPEPVKIAYYHNDKELYFPYDLRETDIAFPVGKLFKRDRGKFTEQLTKISVFFLRDSITDITTDKDFFSDITIIEQDLYKIVSFENGLNAIPEKNNIGTITANNNDKAHTLTINGVKSDDTTTPIYISKELYAETVRDNILQKLEIAPYTIKNNFGTVRSPFPPYKTTTPRIPDTFHITATVDDYYDIVAPNWYEQEHQKQYITPSTVSLLVFFVCKPKKSNTEAVQLSTTLTDKTDITITVDYYDNSMRDSMNYDKMVYTGLPVAMKNTVIDVGFNEITYHHEYVVDDERYRPKICGGNLLYFKIQSYTIIPTVPLPILVDGLYGYNYTLLVDR